MPIKDEYAVIIAIQHMVLLLISNKRYCGKMNYNHIEM